MPPIVLSPRNQARLDAAAAPVLESIRNDRKLAPNELKPLFAYIEANLFDPDFSVGEMLRECGIRDNSISSRFRRHTDMRPRAYVREHRLRVARELLKYAEPEVILIAEMLGFASSQVLSRNFLKRFGVRPRDHRKACAVADPGVAAPDWSVVELLHCLEGRLEPARGLALAREIQDRYTAAGGPAATSAPDADLAAAIWRRIRRLPPEDELPAIREALAAACRELFELLCEKGRVEGRRSRRRGVRLVERAIECLDLCASILGDELPGLKALGWARLGRARRLALDFPAAEEAFRRSAIEWSMQPGGRDPGIEAEILARKAGFRAMQHRFVEAKELADHAIERLPPDLDARLLAEILIIHGSIAFAQGDLEAAIIDFRRAAEVLEPRNGRLRLTVCHNLMAVYIEVGRFTEADELLPQVRELCAAHGEPLERSQLRWVEGRVARGLGRTTMAEDCLHAAHAGFWAVGEIGHAAVVAVELALLYCEEERPEAARYAAEAIPILDAFKIRSEALAARRLLAEAMAHEHLSPKILRKVRTVLVDLARDPAVRLPRSD